MRRSARQSLLSIRAKNSVAIRRTAVFAALMFSLQLGRFYLAAQMNPILCPWDVLETAAETGTDHHHPHNAALLPVPFDHDSGYSFEHCKDRYLGAYMAPVQTLAMPSDTVSLTPQVIWATRSVAVVTVAEGMLPTPFQPPRFSA